MKKCSPPSNSFFIPSSSGYSFFFLPLSPLSHPFLIIREFVYPSGASSLLVLNHLDGCGRMKKKKKTKRTQAKIIKKIKTFFIPRSSLYAYRNELLVQCIPKLRTLITVWRCKQLYISINKTYACMFIIFITVMRLLL